jgi:hypothetical protein
LSNPAGSWSYQEFVTLVEVYFMVLMFVTLKMSISPPRYVTLRKFITMVLFVTPEKPITWGSPPLVLDEKNLANTGEICLCP